MVVQFCFLAEMPGINVFIAWRELMVLSVGLRPVFCFNLLMEAMPSCLEASVKVVEVPSEKHGGAIREFWEYSYLADLFLE